MNKESLQETKEYANKNSLDVEPDDLQFQLPIYDALFLETF